MKRTALALVTGLLVCVVHAPAAADVLGWPTLSRSGENFADGGSWLLGIRYDRQNTDQAYRGCGDVVADATDEVLDFDTIALSVRAGIGKRFNLSASLPYHSIESSLFQGLPYDRVNRGWGDITVTGEYRWGTVSQWALEAGFKFATGSVDKVDEFNQRISDNLALGSGTTDFVAGGGLWAPGFFLHRFDVAARFRHRFSGGENKWGYRHGDRTTFSFHALQSLGARGRLGLRLEGAHARRDTWHGNLVPDQGGSVVYLGPTLALNTSTTSSLGIYARIPVLMDLEGTQLAPPLGVGLEFTGDLLPAFNRLNPSSKKEK